MCHRCNQYVSSVQSVCVNDAIGMCHPAIRMCHCCVSRTTPPSHRYNPYVSSVQSTCVIGAINVCHRCNQYVSLVQSVRVIGTIGMCHPAISVCIISAFLGPHPRAIGAIGMCHWCNQYVPSVQTVCVIGGAHRGLPLTLSVINGVLPSLLLIISLSRIILLL